CHNDGILRSGLDRGFSERQSPWRHVAPVIQLIFPVSITGNARLAQRNSVLGLVPVAGVGDQTHRDRWSDVDGGAGSGNAALRESRNRELHTDQWRYRQRVREAYFVDIP